ncbi:hemerythrin domain-containing protein [Oxalobacteraceae bacterium OM1]|nr:hemerythrin domain-containing protein [Oxalobacteraceae bacterium OM1]
MSPITTFLETDHADCDALFDQAEACVSRNAWEEAATALRSFEVALRRHFAMEEEILFPAFEAATGSTAGPTAVMRSEHAQLRNILDAAGDAVQSRDADAFFGAAETLQIMMGQHNMKEEGILYPMADRALVAQADELVAAMQERAPSGIGVVA